MTRFRWWYLKQKKVFLISPPRSRNANATRSEVCYLRILGVSLKKSMMYFSRGKWRSTGAWPDQYQTWTRGWGVTDFFLFIYPILPAATDASLSVWNWKSTKEWGSASSRSHEGLDFTKLCEQARDRIARGRVVQNLGLHPGGEDNWPVVCFKSSLLMI